jgi:HD domain
MKIPTLDEAEKLLTDAEQRNPGPWVAHSRNVALAAKCIAEYSNLDAEAAYMMGLLHDIGRREGVTGMRHILDGHNFLKQLGYEDAARVCLTHSFPIKDIRVFMGHWDVNENEWVFIQEFQNKLEYNDYDRLMQLCDCLALPQGICLIEKRMIDVALRLGVTEYTVPKWKAYLDIKNYFEQQMGQSIYKVLPGVVETTFNIQ